MKTKILLILCVIFLVASLPFVMGADEKEGKDKATLQQEIDYYKTLLQDVEKDYNDGYKTLKEIEDKLKNKQAQILMERNPYYANQKQDIENQITQTQTEIDQYGILINGIENEFLGITDSNSLLYFDSGEAVQDWVDDYSEDAGTPQTTTEKINWARKLQAAGLSDGYIININFFHNQATGQYEVRCTTNVNGTMYWWNAGTNTVTKDTDHYVRVFKQFSSPWAVQAWLANNSVSDDFVFATGDEWIQAAQQLCADAAADGYYITYSTQSVDGVLTAVECSVNIGGEIYYWDPRDDTVSGNSSLK